MNHYTQSPLEINQQPNIPGFDDIPVVEPTKKPRATPQYYLRAQYQGEWHFVWKTHTNGGAEWMPETELTVNGGRMKPLRYKTLSGAKRMLRTYTRFSDVCEVAAWNE